MKLLLWGKWNIVHVYESEVGKQWARLTTTFNICEQ